MSKNVIYQYWNGSAPNDAVKAGQKNMKKYAEYIGAEYMFETDPPFHGGTCSLKKKYNALRPVYDDIFLDYDNVLFADLDVFTVDGITENIFEEDIKHIGICQEPLQPHLRSLPRVSNNSLISLHNDNIWAKAVKDRYNIEVNRDSENRPLVYNSGVVVFTNEGLIKARSNFVQFEDHINHLKSVGLHSFYLSDQTYYQTMLYASGVDFKILDYKWNSQLHWIRGDTLKVGDGRTLDTNFVHVQISGADNWGEEEHYRMVNFPKFLWNIPTEFDLGDYNV